MLVNGVEMVSKNFSQRVLVDEVEEKIRRNNYLSEDLSLKATFIIEKRVNPALNFSDYIDMLVAFEI